MSFRHVLAGLTAFAACSAPSAASAKVLCTLVMDAADGTMVSQRGDCSTRVTPASTFKVPLAVMGFDSGILTDAHAPVLSFKKGYPDWGGAAWRRPTDPTRWLEYSVVWYSQVITHALGTERLKKYARAFGFGNADFSGDPGKNNGLDRAWISSSLQVSPLEQAAFLRKLVTRQLPASDEAITKTLRIVQVHSAAKWLLHGKTGTAYPASAEGVSDEAHGYGWYVGWATKGERTLIFVRLDQDERADAIPTGLRTRASLLAAWTAMSGETSPHR